MRNVWICRAAGAKISGFAFILSGKPLDLARRRRKIFGICASILSGKRLDLARRRRENFGVCASILSGKPLDLARRRRENFGFTRSLLSLTNYHDNLRFLNKGGFNQRGGFNR